MKNSIIDAINCIEVNGVFKPENSKEEKSFTLTAVFVAIFSITVLPHFFL